MKREKATVLRVARKTKAEPILKDWKPKFSIGQRVMIVRPDLWAGCIATVEQPRNGRYYVEMQGKDMTVFHAEPPEEHLVDLDEWELEN